MKAGPKKITSVKRNSIAEELNICPGDLLVSVNGSKIEDIFDYMYLVENEYIELLIRKANGEEWILEIEKNEDEELGLEFDNGLMDEYKSCRNKCIFCFIDQMPPGMRETLYFKDDDSRLSFLQGNYVTLTNMSYDDIDRIIKYKMSPINISFQAMNPHLRCKMLNNRFAGDILDKAKKLADGGIVMNGQIVLCKGVNDGAELEYSLEVLEGLYPALQSVSVVPVGITKYRQGLYPLEPFGREEAQIVLEQIEKRQIKMKKTYGLNFVYASDEWYIMAGKAIPDDEYYDGYPQLENGVGMIRLFKTEIDAFLKNIEGDALKRRFSIATGKLAYDFMCDMVESIKEKFPNTEVEVYPIRNDFFGETITVSGLITGQDLVAQLKGKALGSRLFIPINMLRAGDEVFLDDMTVSEAAEELNTPILPVENTGDAFCRAILYGEKNDSKLRRQIYEQSDSSDSGKTERR